MGISHKNAGIRSTLLDTQYPRSFLAYEFYTLKLLAVAVPSVMLGEHGVHEAPRCEGRQLGALHRSRASFAVQPVHGVIDPSDDQRSAEACPVDSAAESCRDEPQVLELGDAAGKGHNDAFVTHPVVAVLEFFEERAGVLQRAAGLLDTTNPGDDLGGGPTT